MEAPRRFLGCRDDLRADALQSLDNHDQISDSKAQPDGGIDWRAIVGERIDFDHHVANPPGKMDRPLPVLFLGQVNADSSVEKPNLLGLASFQDQERQQNVSHEPTSTCGPLTSYAVLPVCGILRGGAIMKIVVNNQIHLSEIRPSDKPALIEHLNDRDIYERTFRIPFPYTEADAEAFLARVAKATQQQGQPVHFAIRTGDEALIGGCGFDGFQVGKSHRAEVGYWLAKPLWGQGIMAVVVQRVCQHAFDEFGLVKTIAHVVTHNQASARVLEKCGFVQEGLLRKHFLKDGKFIDVRLFGLLRLKRRRIGVGFGAALVPSFLAEYNAYNLRGVILRRHEGDRHENCRASHCHG